VAEGGTGKFCLEKLKTDELRCQILKTSLATSDLSETGNGISTGATVEFPTASHARIQAIVASQMNGTNEHERVVKRGPYMMTGRYSRNPETAAAAAAAFAAMEAEAKRTANPEAAAAAKAADAAMKAQAATEKEAYEVYKVKVWKWFNDPALRPSLEALVAASFDMERCKAIRAENLAIEAAAKLYQLEARRQEAKKLANSLSRIAANRAHFWERRDEYISTAVGLRELLKKPTKKAMAAAVGVQIQIRRFAFADKGPFNMSGSSYQTTKRTPSELVESLAANLPEEARYGKFGNSSELNVFVI
jgi:hypothetical protein